MYQMSQMPYFGLKIVQLMPSVWLFMTQIHSFCVGVAGQPVTLENINELRDLKHFDLSSSSFNVLEDNTGVVLALIRGDDPDKATILSNSNIEIDELNDSGNLCSSDLNIADATALVNAGVAFTASGYNISDVATILKTQLVVLRQRLMALPFWAAQIL